jgi:hypothetical protein
MAIKCSIFNCDEDFKDRAALYQHQHSVHYCSHNGCSEKFQDSASRKLHIQTPHKKGKTSGKILKYAARIVTNNIFLGKKKSAGQSNTLDKYLSAWKESNNGGQSEKLSVENRKNRQMKPYDYVTSEQRSTAADTGEH